MNQVLILIPREGSEYEMVKDQLGKWIAEIDREVEVVERDVEETRQLSTPDPIPAPRIEPIELPEEAAPQIEIPLEETEKDQG